MKNKIITTIILLLTIILFYPNDTFALEKNNDLIECKYIYENIELNYKLTKTDVELPFKNGEKLSNLEWYNSDDFKDSFIKSSKTSNKKIVCPTLTIEENDMFTTVFVGSKDQELCNGRCTKVNSNNNKLNVIDTKITSSVGKYNESGYFIPAVRLLSDNTYEWSLDGKVFSSINKTMNIDNKSVISIDKNLIKKSFTNNDNLINIYRCVSKEGKNYKYYLASNKKYCKNDLSSNDGQGEKALNYNASFGEGEDCNSILGNPTNPNSPAWLLKKLLDYLKILGPMIVLVMSSIDFIKALLASDDESMQKAYKKLITRLVLALLLFFIPELVELLLEIFGFMTDPLCGLK